MLGGNWGLGFNLASSILGGDPNRAAREEANRQRIAEYRRRILLMQARRASGTIQYRRGIRKNLGAASAAVSANNRKYQELLEDTRWKQFEVWRDNVATTGKEAAAGMTGKTARRIAAVRRGQAGVSKAQLARQMTNASWRFNASTKSIWEEYKSANRQTYDQSGIGRLAWAGPAPTLLKGPGFMARLAPVLGVLGNHFVSKYQGNVKTTGSYLPSNNTNISYRDMLSMKGPVMSGLEIQKPMGNLSPWNTGSNYNPSSINKPLLPGLGLPGLDNLNTFDI